MPYGTLKVDNIIFTNGGVDQTITVSGIVASTSGNLTVTGTISGNIIRGGTTVSGATVTGSAGQFGNLTAVSGTFTTISGGTYTLTSGVFASGTAANPSISFVSDPNTGIYSPGADQVAISTSGTGRLFVNSSGRLLVGTSTARANYNGYSGDAPKFQIEGSSYLDGSASFIGNSSIFATWGPHIALGRSRGGFIGSNTIVQNGDVTGAIVFHGNDGTNFIQSARIDAYVDGTPGANDMPGRLVFSTTADGASSPLERMRISNAGTTTLTSAISTAPFIATIDAAEVARIDSSGRLLVGTSTARSNFYNTSTIAPALQVEGTSFSGSSLSLVANGNASASTPYSICAFGRSRGTTVGSNTVVASGDYLGEITFQGSDGTEFVNAATITAIVDGTPGANDMPGRLVFSTTADGASSPTERMRIDSAGLITIAGSLKDPAITGTILEDVFTITDGAAFEIDPSNGSVQLITLGASRTPKGTNFAAGEAITLMVDDGSAYTLTWTDATWGGSGVVWKTDSGVAPTLNTSGYTVITLWKVSTQVYGARVGNA